MNSRKRILAVISFAVVLFLCDPMPLTALGQEPCSAAKKKAAKAKSPNENTSPDNVKVGGKSLSQWRALFGETSKQPDTASDFAKSIIADAPSSKPNPKQCIQPSAGQDERRTADRILADARKVHWIRLAVIANNMANADTVGYKRNRTLFEGSVHCVEMEGNDWSTRGQLAATGISASGGGPVLTVQTDFRQGRLKKTGRMLDIAIEGKGFLQVINPHTSETLYTRAGNLSINDQGQLCVGPGKKSWLIEPGITVPLDATAITVKSDGCVYAKQPGTVSLTPVGQVQMARFINPEGLQRLGGKLFGETEASGVVIPSNPGQDSLGIIRQGHLEQSNVDLPKELADWKATIERINTLDQKFPN